MEPEPESRKSRREELRQRIDSIRTRIDELEASRQDDTTPATPGERLASAHRHATASQDAAHEAIAASVRAFRGAAEAHERVAREHERAATAGFGDSDEHEQLAAFHRAAAAADTRRAEHTQSLLQDAETNSTCGPGAGQASDPPASPAGRRAADLPPPEP